MLILITGGFAIAACSDDDNNNPLGNNDEVGDGDGDPTSDGEATGDGDGDGNPTGDGDGAGEGDGDGDGEATGDGDGDGNPTGDGDGDDTTGDGDGDGSPSGDGLCRSSCGATDCGACPNGPISVAVGDYQIDGTEVTAAQYAQFLEVEFAPDYFESVLPTGCEFKTDFTPALFPANPPESIPVVGVDWCDAWAYCNWAGKHLCGSIGGGPAPLNEVQNPATNEWYQACTHGGVNNYPYGLGYDPSACNTQDAEWEQLTDVGGLPTCEGGYPGVFDMSGNVWEWTNACNDQGECRRRGGSMYSNAVNARCGIDSVRSRDFRADSQGFRCCSDL
ncbi:MAG: SUMF1/EgtB/PvdO family nonheme iron enzyme [Enhygromyxa sp.]